MRGDLGQLGGVRVGLGDANVERLCTEGARLPVEAVALALTGPST